MKKKIAQQALLLSICIGATAAMADSVPLVAPTASKYDSALRSCIQDKLGSKDRNGYPANDYRAEVPGTSVIVDPSQVKFEEMDVDMWTSIDGFSFGTYRNEPAGAKISNSQILAKAKAEKKMVKITKLDHTKSQGPFTQYDQAIQFELTDQPIPEHSDAVQALYASCEKVGVVDPNVYVGAALSMPTHGNPQANDQIAKRDAASVLLEAEVQGLSGSASQ